MSENPAHRPPGGCFSRTEYNAAECHVHGNWQSCPLRVARVLRLPSVGDHPTGRRQCSGHAAAGTPAAAADLGALDGPGGRPRPRRGVPPGRDLAARRGGPGAARRRAVRPVAARPRCSPGSCSAPPSSSRCCPGPLNVAWYAWLALALADTVIFAVLAIAQRLLLRLPGWPVAVAGWWVAAEALRDRWPFGGFPWGRLAMSQATAPTRGWAAIGGAPLLTFAVALAGAALGWLLLALLSPERRASRRGTIRAAAAFAVTAALACLPAVLPLDPVPAGSKTAEVAAIQGNVPTGQDAGRAAQRLDGHAQPRRRDRQARVQGRRGPGDAARPGDLAGELHRHRPHQVRAGLPGDRVAPPPRSAARSLSARCFRARCATPACSGCRARARRSCT